MVKDNADVRQLRDSLGSFPAVSRSPFLVVVSGLPGTGKSHFCRRLVADVPALILESDALRKTLFPSPNYSAAESSRLFRAAHALIEQLLGEGVPVIFDATNLSERHRRHLYDIAAGTGARLVLVQVEAPPGVVYTRLKARERNPEGEKSDAGWAVYHRMRPQVERIRRPHHVVDTSRDIEGAVAEIVKELKS